MAEDGAAMEGVAEVAPTAAGAEGADAAPPQETPAAAATAEQPTGTEAEAGAREAGAAPAEEAAPPVEGAAEPAPVPTTPVPGGADDDGDDDDLFGDMSDDEPTTAAPPTAAPPTAAATAPAAEGEDGDAADDDLFGDVSDDDEQGPATGSQAAPADSQLNSQALEGDEEEEPEEEFVSVQIPTFGKPLGEDVFLVKLPNFVSIDPRPFNADTYKEAGEDEEDQLLDHFGRKKTKLKVENTVRWRNVEDADGNTRRESNARFVRWSDGSLSLMLGDEVIEAQQKPVGGRTHLFCEQLEDLGGVEAQYVLKHKLIFRPPAINSDLHRRLTLSVADKLSDKRSKIKMITVKDDPDAMKREAIKKDEERIRAQVQLENKQRRRMESYQARPGLDAAHLDSEDDEDMTDSIDVVKRLYGKGKGASGAGVAAYEDEEDEEDDDFIVHDEPPAKDAVVARKGRLMDDDDSDGEADSGAAQAQKRRRKAVDDDEDD